MFGTMNIVRPNEPSKCLYHQDKHASNPHGEYIAKPTQKIYPDILHAIGNTPIVKLNRIPQSLGIKCDILAKCEYLNPGGSVKDRIAISMVEDAERKGLLKPGFTVVEPTSGNTGIAVAMACAVKGYKCICVLQDKTSTEKEDVLQSLGAEVVRAPNVPFDDPEGVFMVSEKILQATPNSVMLRQFNNPNNPIAHYYRTAMEIFDQCDGEVDMVVVGIGSGGTATGVGRRLKELLPHCLIVGVDPVGSSIAEPPSLNETDVTDFTMEGIGHHFHPSVLDKSLIDFWIKVNDKSAFEMARRLHSEEGILCGASAGCLMSGALEAAKQLTEGQRCVVMFPDGASSYVTKFISDYWMESNNFMQYSNAFNHWWWNYKVLDLKLQSQNITISLTMTCRQVSIILKKEKLDLLPCVDDHKVLQGLLYVTDLISQLLKNTVTPNDPINKVLSHKYRTVTINSTLGKLSHILQRELVAVVVEENTETAAQPTTKLKGLLYSTDLLDFITDNNINK